MIRAGLVLLLVAGCAADPIPYLADGGVPDSQGQDWLVSPDSAAAADGGPLLQTACSSTEGATVPEGLSPHFKAWLASKGYPTAELDRADLSGGSFGGLESASDCLRREPVIFIHGNADRALGGPFGGWDASLEHFVDQGYRRAELYATTYGPAEATMIWSYTHSRANIMQVRTFIEAVLAYTGAQKVDVIAHSMGVTMARKAILGGQATDPAAGGEYQVGPPLTDRIDTFVGIAGGNLGLSACYTTPAVPACGVVNGFYPGQLVWGQVLGQSAFIEELNQQARYEGSYRYSIWSAADEVVGGACLVWGKNTCRVPGHTDEKVYYSPPYGHYGLRDLTADVQLAMITRHCLK